MPKLHIISKILQGAVFELPGDYLTIGRGADNSIMLDHTSVSKHHAMLTADDGDFKLWDLHSTNGVIVNNETVVVRYLKDGDRIVLGEIELRFESDSKAATQQLPLPVQIVAATVAREIPPSTPSPLPPPERAAPSAVLPAAVTLLPKPEPAKQIAVAQQLPVLPAPAKAATQVFAETVTIAPEPDLQKSNPAPSPVLVCDKIQPKPLPVTNQVKVKIVLPLGQKVTDPPVTIPPAPQVKTAAIKEPPLPKRPPSVPPPPPSKPTAKMAGPRVVRRPTRPVLIFLALFFLGLPLVGLSLWLRMNPLLLFLGLAFGTIGLSGLILTLCFAPVVEKHESE